MRKLGIYPPRPCSAQTDTPAVNRQESSQGHACLPYANFHQRTSKLLHYTTKRGKPLMELRARAISKKGFALFLRTSLRYGRWRTSEQFGQEHIDAKTQLASTKSPTQARLATVQMKEMLERKAREL